MSTQTLELDDEAVEAAAATLRLLADPTRLRIVWALLHGEHSVNDLAEHVGAQAAAVSQHLAKLRLSGLVRARREGNRIFYAARDEHIRRLAAEALFQVGVDAKAGAAAGHHGRRAVS